MPNLILICRRHINCLLRPKFVVFHKGRKLWQKEKLLLTSIFTSSLYIFKSPLSPGCSQQAFSGKGLTIQSLVPREKSFENPLPTICSKGCYFRVIVWLIVWCLNLFSTIFQLYCVNQCFYPCFPGVLLSSSPRHILSKPLAAFPHNHCRNNRQWWERNESCGNDYHQSSERIVAEQGIKPATSCSWVLCAISRAMGLCFRSLNWIVW